MKGRIREQAFLLGPRKSLVGVVSEGGASEMRPDRPAIVILNAGIVHRVGPTRLNVLLARSLAESGHTVLRFDLSGLGDSEARSDGMAPLEAVLADIREALDWLESARKVRRVVLAGLCSGANHGLLYGGSDPRVVGLVLIDPATPRTLGYYVRHFVPRLFRLRAWSGVLRGEHPLVRRLVDRLAGRSEEPGGRPGLELNSPQVRSGLEHAYQSALDQGVRFLAIFTGGQEDQHNYREQVLDAFPRVSFGDRIRLEYFAGADHTFTSEADRSRLLSLVVEWAERAGFSRRPDVPPADG